MKRKHININSQNLLQINPKSSFFSLYQTSAILLACYKIGLFIFFFSSENRIFAKNKEFVNNE